MSSGKLLLLQRDIVHDDMLARADRKLPGTRVETLHDRIDGPLLHKAAGANVDALDHFVGRATEDLALVDGDGTDGVVVVVDRAHAPRALRLPQIPDAHHRVQRTADNDIPVHIHRGDHALVTDQRRAHLPRLQVGNYRSMNYKNKNKKIPNFFFFLNKQQKKKNK